MLFSQELFCPVLDYAIDITLSNISCKKDISNVKRTLESLYCKAAGKDPELFENQLKSVVYKDNSITLEQNSVGKALAEKLASNFYEDGHLTSAEKELILLLQHHS